MTTTAEPFLRQVTDPGTIANLWNAGYTAAADQACQQEAVKAHLVWQQTFSDLSFNPFQAILSATSYTTDEAFTASMISYCRQILGELCILENNSLRSTSMSKNSNAMYASIAALGANISFQTAILSRIGSLPATLDLAVGFGAGSVELPNEYRRMAPNTFDAVRLKLIANSRP
jgi:hypothetical protein